MVGKRTNRQIAKGEGLERTDNNLELTNWPQVTPINQKNYYTEYLKREDQILVLRLQNEDNRNRMARDARDRDRALAQADRDGLPTSEAPDADMQIDGDASAQDATTPIASEVVGSKTIVVHSGSQNLRIGLASDALPKTVPMVIARRWGMSESEEEEGEPRPKRVKVDGETPHEPEKWFGEEFAGQYTTMSAELKVRMRNHKLRMLPNSKELVVNYNRRTVPETISEHNDPHRVEWTNIIASPQRSPDIFTGQAALRIPDYSKPRYKLFWPIQHGRWNEKDYDNKNLMYQDFASILEDAVKYQLGLQRRKDWAQYGCVFIIPDLYERCYVTSVLDVLLRDFGFGKVCFIQESLAASFGAGYSMGCIVDVGDQKTSICCVDEGLCVEGSRINLKYGGHDVTELFMKMMLYDHFPYAEINLKRRYDYLLAEELKQKYCTMNGADISVQLFDFHLRASGQDTRKYQFKTFDETMLAPMGYFRPLIFDHAKKLSGRRKLIDRSYDLYDGTPNDPVSAGQLTVLEWANSKGLSNGTASHASFSPPSQVTNTSSTKPTSNLLNRLNVEFENTPRSSVTGSPAPDGTPQPSRGTPAVPAVEKEEPQVDPIEEAQKAARERDIIVPIMPLDSAIITSITQGARGDERKMRDFLGGIMVIGGGAKFPSFNGFLEEKLKELRPNLQKDILIGSPPRDLDPQVLVWKGGSVFGKLSGTNDSWIGQMEYDRLGNRVLAYKCMWAW